MTEVRGRSWQAHKEMGIRGFAATSTTTLLLDFGFQGQSKELSEAAAEKASQWLWLQCSQTTWGHVNELYYVKKHDPGSSSRGSFPAFPL